MADLITLDLRALGRARHGPGRPIAAQMGKGLAGNYPANPFVPDSDP